MDGAAGEAGSRFTEDLAALCSKELSAARRDPERISEMIERLASVLAMAVATAAEGRGPAIDELCAGLDRHIHEQARRGAGGDNAAG